MWKAESDIGQWLGLANSKAANIVWWNSLTGITSGFASTSDFFVTSGIHSPQKYPNEPFRWAGDWPVDEIQTLGVPTEIPVDTSTPSNLPLSALVTTAYTNMSFTTRKLHLVSRCISTCRTAEKYGSRKLTSGNSPFRDRAQYRPDR